ncbi:hypothetical protein WJX81_000955 [Elliptochloris bilobata]|uniref:Mitochondrial carrier protein n=1 Tax=Elliptochloris bilobata TaxID=381761 RepID=A0AAW1QK20_9CHLO
MERVLGPIAQATPWAAGRFRAARRRLRSSALARDAVCGAVGEVAQLVLYPLDTLTVQCQAGGLGVRGALAALRAQQLGPTGTLRALYAGCGPTVACSVVIGAVYLCSFYHTKRWAAGVGISGTEGGLLAALFAGVVSSVATSALESPMELFRHRVQAGVLRGRLLAGMAAAVGGGGIGQLYAGFVPFLVRSVPYDVAELATYSHLASLQRRACVGPVADMAIGALAGAAAVLASMPLDVVKTRMEVAPLLGLKPCFKPHPTAAPGALLAGLREFGATGHALVAAQGPGALFSGLAPRLAGRVPGSIVYWLAVAACRRALEADGDADLADAPV